MEKLKIKCPLAPKGIELASSLLEYKGEEITITVFEEPDSEAYSEINKDITDFAFVGKFPKLFVKYV